MSTEFYRGVLVRFHTKKLIKEVSVFLVVCVVHQKSVDILSDLFGDCLEDHLVTIEELVQCEMCMPSTMGFTAIELLVFSILILPILTCRHETGRKCCDQFNTLRHRVFSNRIKVRLNLPFSESHSYQLTSNTFLLQLLCWFNNLTLHT